MSGAPGTDVVCVVGESNFVSPIGKGGQWYKRCANIETVCGWGVRVYVIGAIIARLLLTGVGLR